MELVVARADRFEVRGVELGGETSRRSTSPSASSAVSVSVSTTPVTRWAAPGTGRPPTPGAFAEDVLERERRVRLVLGPDVDEVERMRGRRHVREVELGDLGDGVEDRAELAGQPLDLVVGRGRGARAARRAAPALV